MAEVAGSSPASSTIQTSGSRPSCVRASRAGAQGSRGALRSLSLGRVGPVAFREASKQNCADDGGERPAVAAASPSAVIRGYDRRDRPAIREICRPAARAQPDPLFHEDGELAPRLLTDYYLDHEPDCCFVAEVDQRIVGYIVGCKDTEASLRAVRRWILPRMLLRIMRSVITLRYRQRTTYHALWWHLVAQLPPRRAGRMTPPLATYPAHSHFNVAAGSRGRGIGYALSHALHEHLRARGVKGLHAIVLEPAGSDSISRYLCDRRGHRVVATREHVVLRRVTWTGLRAEAAGLRSGT